MSEQELIEIGMKLVEPLGECLASIYAPIAAEIAVAHLGYNVFPPRLGV